MRKHVFFDVADSRCAATIDLPQIGSPAESFQQTGFFIVSGGNEIRSGAHGGQADLAGAIAKAGHPVFRYDRRGVGDSEGVNSEFEDSEEDLQAALAAFRSEHPQIERIIGFGNCDAASALALFHGRLPLHGIILANPWVNHTSDQPKTAKGKNSTPSLSAGAIRSRYLNRIKDPRSIIDLLTGKINLRKLAGGLAKASRKEAPSGLAERIARALTRCDLPIRILIARHDNTALSFMTAWNDDIFAPLRPKANIEIRTLDSASHSFAGAKDKEWLHAQILEMLKAA